jgi:hypothetical protein
MGKRRVEPRVVIVVISVVCRSISLVGRVVVVHMADNVENGIHAAHLPIHLPIHPVPSSRAVVQLVLK